jgi:uncharacterized protein
MSNGPRVSRAYADPYVAGFALGLVLLGAFVLMGRGLGASGAFARVAANTAAIADSASASRNAYFAGYNSSGSLVSDWLVIELIGVCIGGALSAWFAGRMIRMTERGPRVNDVSRLAVALGGGSVMGAGAVIARGCTSGQALTGGAMLSVGSWCFMIAAFAGAFAAAPALRRMWT